MIRLVLLPLLFAALTVSTASAETLKKSYSYFSVGGKTLEDLERELNRRGPKVKTTGQRHPGATRMQFNTRLGYSEVRGSCRIKEASVTVTAKVILPKWRRRGGADADARLVWDTLSSDIKRHEEQHVAIAQDYARKLERKLKRLGRHKNCNSAAQKAEAAADAILRKHDAAQARFDMKEAAGFEKRLLKLMDKRIKLIEAGRISG